MHPHSVEVDLENGEGIVNIPWSNLQKYVVIGDFAKVISGALCGEAGWVIETKDKRVQITESLELQDTRGSSVCHNISIQLNFCNQPLISLYQEVHINWVTVIDLLLSFTKQQSTSSSTPADPLKIPFAKDAE
jgi:ribosomal protein L24